MLFTARLHNETIEQQSEFSAEQDTGSSKTACKFHFVPFALFNYLLGLNTLASNYYSISYKNCPWANRKKTPTYLNLAKLQQSCFRIRTTEKHINSQQNTMHALTSVYYNSNFVFSTCFLDSCRYTWHENSSLAFPWV